MPFVEEFGLPGAAIAEAAFAGGQAQGLVQREELEERRKARIAQQENQERNRQAGFERQILDAQLKEQQFEFRMSAAVQAKQQQLQGERIRWDEARDNGEISQKEYQQGLLQFNLKEAGLEALPKEKAEFPIGQGPGQSWKVYNDDDPNLVDAIMTRDHNNNEKVLIDVAKNRREAAKEVAVQVEKDRIEEKERIEKVQDRVLEIQDKQRDHVVAGMKDFESVVKDDPKNPEKVEKLRREEREVERLRLQLEALEFFPMNLGRPLVGGGDTRPSSDVAFPTTRAEFDALPIGTIFHDPDDPPGVNRRKGG